MIGANLIEQFQSRPGGGDAELFLQSLPASLELLKRRRPVTRQVMQLHYLCLRPFGDGVVMKNRLAILQSFLVFAVFEAIADEFVERGQEHVLQTLALVQAPVMVIAFEKIAAIKLDSLACGSSRFGIKLTQSFQPRADSLELFDVNPPVNFRIQSHALAVNHYQALAGGRVG